MTGQPKELQSDHSGIRCHSLLGCEPPTSEAETEKGWVPVCDRCMQTAWEQGLRVRKLQRGAVALEAGSWGRQAINPEYQR